MAVCANARVTALNPHGANEVKLTGSLLGTWEQKDNKAWNTEKSCVSEVLGNREYQHRKKKLLWNKVKKEDVVGNKGTRTPLRGP